MSLKIRKRIKTPTGLFFTSIEMWKRVEVRVNLFFMSMKTRKWIKTPTGLFFTSIEMWKRVEVRVDLFFMSMKTRKRIKTPTGLFFFYEHRNVKASWGPGGPLFQTRVGLFFTSFEMREWVWVRVPLFFISLKTRKRIKTRVGLFSRDSFFLTLACYNGNRKSKGG